MNNFHFSFFSSSGGRRPAEVQDFRNRADEMREAATEQEYESWNEEYVTWNEAYEAWEHENSAEASGGDSEYSSHSSNDSAAWEPENGYDEDEDEEINEHEAADLAAEEAREQRQLEKSAIEKREIQDCLKAQIGEQWAKNREKFFADRDGTQRVPFPIPPSSGPCLKVNSRMDGCVRGEKLGVCHHAVEKLLEGKDLIKERLQWHPDRFVRRGVNQEYASEMFQLVQRLIDGW